MTKNCIYNMNLENLIRILKTKYNEEEIKEMQKDYGKNFDRVFDDRELCNIEESEEEIVLTKKDEKELLDLVDDFE